MATLSDTFNRADNADLSVSAPFSWTDLVGDFQIVGNQVKAVSGTNVANRSRAESALASADMGAQVTVIVLNASVSRHIEALVRYDSAADTAYGVRMSGPVGGNSTVRPFKVVAGAYTLLGAGTSVAYAVNDTVGVEVEGSAPTITLRTYHNGTLQETVSGESSIDANLRTGIGNNGNNANTAIIDNFLAGELGAPVITYNGGAAATIEYQERLTTAVATMTATGPPDTAWSLSGADAAKFAVDSVTGVITPVAALDYETPTDANADNDYLITATATSRGGVDSIALTIRITDVIPRLSVVQFALPTVAGDVDITVAGTGPADHQCALLLFGSIGTVNGTAVNSAEWGFGVATGTATTITSNVAGMFGHSSREAHAVTLNKDGHSESFGHTYYLIELQPDETPAPNDTKFTSKVTAKITDGWRLNVNPAPAVAHLVNAVLLTGDWDARLLIVPSEVAGDVDVTVPFEAPCGLIFSQGDGFGASPTLGHGGYGGTSICFFRNEAGVVTYAGDAHGFRGHDTLIGDDGVYGKIVTDRHNFWPPQDNNIDSLSRHSVSFPIATTCRVTTAANQSVGAQVAVLLLKPHGRRVRIGVGTVPASTGVQSISASPALPSDFTPQALIAIPGRLEAAGTPYAKDARAGSFGLAAVARPGLGGAGNGEYCETISCNADMTSATDTQSLTDDQLINVPAHDGSAPILAAFDSFAAGDVRINVTAAPTTAVKFPFFALEGAATAASGDTNPSVNPSVNPRTNPLTNPLG